MYERLIKNWVLYAIALAYGISFWYFPANDPDLGWQLFGGYWISLHRAIPSFDPVNTFNLFWHDYHWLIQVVFYKFFSWGGYSALRVLFGLNAALLAVIVLDAILISLPKHGSRAAALLALLTALVLIEVVSSIRPQIFALTLVALSVHRLIQHPRAYEIPYLFLLTIILVNVHVYWVLVPFLWFAYRCLPRFLRSNTFSPAYAWGGLVMISVSGLISPYGLIDLGYEPPFFLMNYAVIWDYLVMPSKLSRTINEFTPLVSAQGLAPWLVIAYMVCFVRLFRLNRALVSIGQTVSAITFTILALRGIKFVSTFAVTALPFVLMHSGAAIKSAKRMLPVDVEKLALMLSLFILALSLIRAVIYSPWSYDNDDRIAAYRPVKACSAMARLHLKPSNDRTHVRVLTNFNQGGWCRWILSQQDPDTDYRVTTDGRTQGVPVQHFFDSFDLFSVRGRWWENLAKWQPDVALVPKSRPLAQFMVRADSEWQLVFQDDNFAVFTPTQLKQESSS